MHVYELSSHVSTSSTTASVRLIQFSCRSLSGIGHQAATLKKSESINSPHHIFVHLTLNHFLQHVRYQSSSSSKTSPRETERLLVSLSPQIQREQFYEGGGEVELKGADNRSCRLTGAATFTGVGIYALRQAQLQGTFQRVRPKGGSIVGGQVTAVIGIGEFTSLLILFEPVWVEG